MKLLGFEDMIVGILLGIALIGASGKYFTLPYNDVILNPLLFLFALLAVLDVIHEIRTHESSKAWTLFAIVWNVAELIIVSKYIADFLKIPLTLPFEIDMVWAGAFFIFGGIMWMYFYFKH